jgi:hypothetical protein
MGTECKLTGLSGNEIYCMRLKGLTPSGVVIGNSIQSMGFLGGVRSAFRGIVGGEIPDVTNMIHEGREAAFVRMRAEADRERVGTAIRKLPGMGVKTQMLPAQAIIRDKDTWLSGSGGFDLTSIRAGG